MIILVGLLSGLGAGLMAPLILWLDGLYRIDIGAPLILYPDPLAL